MAPLGSIVIPCFNVENCVERAVVSALDQSVPVKIICVDDGSSDGTLEILRNLAEAHPDTIEVLTGPNSGACSARNKGLARCSSAYIQFLDADDTIDPTKIEVQIGLARKHNSDFVAGSYRYRALDGTESVRCSRPGSPWVRLFQKQIGNTVANLWKRDALEAVGGWDEGLASSQEADLMARLLGAKANVIFDTEPRMTVYAREGSISYSFSGPNRERYARIRVQSLEHCESNALLEETDLANAREAVFNSIRWLYPFSPETALAYYRRAFPERYSPPVSKVNTRWFVWACRAFGYAMAERLRAPALK